jgi:hypothetical protein
MAPLKKNGTKKMLLRQRILKMEDFPGDDGGAKNMGKIFMSLPTLMTA